MSFYTALQFYRPTPPPVVIGDELAKFVGKMRDTRLLNDSPLNRLEVKFGGSIDQDLEHSFTEVEIVPCISRVEDIEWDIELGNRPSTSRIVEALAGEQRTIYRARLEFGSPVESVRKAITRTNSSENSIGYYPDTLGFEIEPIRCCSLASDAPIYVGWMSLSFHGGGYLYPWTFREAIDRALGCPEINRLIEVCRSMWPVRPDKPSARIVKLRKNKLTDLWPYDDFEKPMDWYWGLDETG